MHRTPQGSCMARGRPGREGPGTQTWRGQQGKVMQGLAGQVKDPGPSPQDTEEPVKTVVQGRDVTKFAVSSVQCSLSTY